MFRTRKPRVPVSRRTINAENLFFSKRINEIDAVIKKYGITGWMYEFILGIKIIDGIVISARIIFEIRLPYFVKIIAC